MHISFTVYKHSALATALNIMGVCLVVSGATVLVSGEVVAAIVMLVIGVAFLPLAEVASERKKQKILIKIIKKRGMESMISSDVDFAIMSYNKCPGSKTLAYIKRLNPTAANQIAAIKQNRKNEKKRVKQNN